MSQQKQKIVYPAGSAFKLEQPQEYSNQAQQHNSLAQQSKEEIKILKEKIKLDKKLYQDQIKFLKEKNTHVYRQFEWRSHNFWKQIGNDLPWSRDNLHLMHFLRHFIQFSPNVDYSTQGLGCVQDQTGLLDPIKQHSTYMVANNNTPSPYDILGLYYLITKDYDNAQNWYKCLEKKQGYQQFIGLANIYYNQGKYEQAEYFYRKVISLKHQLARPNQQIALIKDWKQDKPCEGRKLALQEEAISTEINPRHEQLHNSLGNVYLSKGDYDEAIKCYLKCIELNAKYLAPYDGLSNAYSKKGNVQEAKMWQNRKVQASK